MAAINLSGKAPKGKDFERVTLEDKSRHTATLEDCRVQEVPDYDTGRPTEKLIIDWKIDGKLVPMWVNPRVSKGSGRFSNSKLYDVLNILGKLDDFAKRYGDESEIANGELASFMVELKGTKAEVEVTNAKRGTPEEYSTIGDIIKKA